MTTIKEPICYKCEHFYETNPMTLTCSAFPDGIIDRILNGYSKHKTPISGDNGKVFKEMTGDPLATE